MNVYALFAIRKHLVEDRLVVTLVRYLSGPTKPKDDTFDVNAQTLFFRVGTPAFDAMMKRVEVNLPERLKQHRRACKPPEPPKIEQMDFP